MLVIRRHYFATPVSNLSTLSGLRSFSKRDSVISHELPSEFVSTLKRELCAPISSEQIDPFASPLAVPLLCYCSEVLSRNPSLCKPLIEGDKLSPGLLHQPLFLSDIDRYHWLLDLIQCTDSDEMRQIEQRLLKRLKLRQNSEAAQYFEDLISRPRVPFFNRFIAADHIANDFDTDQLDQLMAFFLSDEVDPTKVTADITPHCSSRRLHFASLTVEAPEHDDAFFRWATEQSCTMISSLCSGYFASGTNEFPLDFFSSIAQVIVII